MAFAQRLNRWLNRTYRFVAIVLVVFAVLLSAIRLLIPYGNGLRSYVENYLAEQYHGQISIERLSTDWGEDGPVLVAENVTLLETEGLSITIGTIDLRLDFWGSITEQRLITSYFTLNQAIVTFNEERFKMQASSGGSTIELVDNLLELFLHQINHFKVNDSHIYFADVYGKMRHLAISRLSWNNQGLRHQAVGDFEIAGLSKNNARFILDLEGKKLNEMQGQLYTQAANINLSPVLKRVSGIGSESVITDLNFELWAGIDNGKLQSVQLALGENKMSWQDGIGPRELVLAPGQLQWQRVAASTQNNERKILLPAATLTSSELVLTMDDEVDFPFTLSASHYDKDIAAHISGINLEQIAAIADVFVDDAELVREIDQMAVQGKINDLHLRGQIMPDKSPTFSAVAQLKDLNWRASDAIPGVEKLNGEVVYHDNQVALTLNSAAGAEADAKQLALDFGHHFSRPIPYRSLAVSLSAEWSNQGFTLTVPEVALTSDELSLTGEVVFDSNNQQESPYMAIYALVENADASKTQYYLPLSIMGDDLVEYLNESIHSGTLETTRVLLNGPINNYPFIDETGIFKVEGMLKNGHFSFDQKWPAITKLDALLDFTNDGMKITVADGDLTGLNPKGTVAAIDSFSGVTVLEVESDVFASYKSLKTLMDDSPLANSVGVVLDIVKVKEAVTGEFKLTLPFEDLEQTVAQGLIKLDGHHVDLMTPEMSFANVKGQITFVNDDVTYSGLTLDWRGLPMTLDGRTFDGEDYYSALFNFTGNWPKEAWQTQVPDELTRYADGALDWQGELKLYFPPENDFSYQANFRSELEGLALKLPAPYTKTAQQQESLIARVNGDRTQTTITSTLGDELEFYGKLNHETVHFERAHLVLGNDKMLLPMDGFHITASFNQIDYQPWQDLVVDIIASLPTGGEGQPLIESPERIRGNVNQLNVWGQKFNAVSFNVLDKKDWWLVQLNADKARAQVKLHNNFAAYGVDIEADFVHLDNDFETDGTQDDGQFNQLLYDKLVPIRLNCVSCRYQKFDFGQVDAEIERDSDNNIALKSFNAQRKGFSISSSGVWRYQDGVNSTQLSGDVKIDDLEREIAALDFSTLVKDSGMEVGYNLDWPGSPQDFALNKLNGDIRVELDDGYLEDVDDKGARLFSIFSMRSLVRKLTLDFRDVFSNGMFYDDIKGDFTIEQGVFTTDNVRMNGAAGDILVVGTTDLNDQTLNYQMGFTPKVTASIPVLVAWMVNPIAGLATLAVDKMIESAEVIAKINFELTGTIDNPEFREVNRRSRDVQVDTENDKVVDKPKQEPPPPPVNEKPRKFNQSSLPTVPPIKPPNSSGPLTEQGVSEGAVLGRLTIPMRLPLAG